jgi:hypothetical protein
MLTHNPRINPADTLLLMARQAAFLQGEVVEKIG